jgi:hypothetical protein
VRCKARELEKVENLCRSATGQHAMPRDRITMRRVFYQTDSRLCETAVASLCDKAWGAIEGEDGIAARCSMRVCESIAMMREAAIQQSMATQVPAIISLK